MALFSVTSKCSAPEVCLKGQPKITTKKIGLPDRKLRVWKLQREKEKRD